MDAAFLEAILADNDTAVAARAGDIVVYETLEPSSSSTAAATGGLQWRWAVGEVLRQPTARITELRMWRRKEKLLDMTERMKSDQLRNELAARKQDLEKEKQLVLSDQNSIAARRMRTQKKVALAENKIRAAHESMAEAQLLVAAITDKQWAEVRGYSSPPPTVRLVLEAVLLLLRIPFAKGDWKEVRERVRDKDFIRLVSSYSAKFLPPAENVANGVATVASFSHALPATVDPTAIQAAEEQYLPLLTVEKVRHSSKAAVALHAWIAAMCYAMNALKEMALIQEEIVLLDFEISELGEDSDANMGKIRSLERDVLRLENELEDLFKEAEAADDMFLMTTINTARGAGGGGGFLGGTLSDVSLAKKSEFYSTLDTKFILSCQIFANLEHDVERHTERRKDAVAAPLTKPAAGVAAAKSKQPQLDCSAAEVDMILHTLRIDPMKVLMTARGNMTARGGGGGGGGGGGFAALAAGSALPSGFKLAAPPVPGSPTGSPLKVHRDPTATAGESPPPAGDGGDNGALLAENAKLRKLNAEAHATIALLKKQLVAAGLSAL